MCHFFKTKMTDTRAFARASDPCEGEEERRVLDELYIFRTSLKVIHITINLFNEKLLTDLKTTEQVR
jgi:hypothetical protein